MVRQLKKRNREKTIIVESLKSLLQCDDSESSEIYYNYVNEISELESAKKNIKYLLNLNVKLRTIKENGFLLPMPIGTNYKIYLARIILRIINLFLEEIEEKLNILKSMKPKNIEDFIPLMIADTISLEKYQFNLENCYAIESNHPIYYFSEKLEVR